jgi:eukaryotic-like serine/threonine-protein kinase
VNRLIWSFTAACSLLLSWSALGAHPLQPRIKWSFQAEGPIRGSASIEGGSIYFGSADGFVYALNKNDASLQWKFQTGGAIAGAPAVTPSMVIVAGRGQSVYALSRKNGAVVWSFETLPTLTTPTEWNYFTASPVVTGDQVLVPSGDGHLYSLDLPSGKKRWAFKTGDSLRATPLVVGDTIYQPSGDDHVYALSSRGTLLWKFATAGVNYDLSKGFIRSDIFTRPALKDGLLIFGSRDANVYAVDVSRREKAWTFAYDSTWAMSTAIDEDSVFVGWSTNNKINALDLKTGKQKWEFDAGSHTYTTALVVNDALYFGSANGAVHALNKRDGSLKWRYSVGADIYSSLVHDENSLYFGTDDGRFIALTQEKRRVSKAVYLPAAVPDNIRGFIVDPAITPYFVERGYRQLDSAAALVDWLSQRAHHSEPSVVVFAFAQIPKDAIGEDPTTGPLRSYLERGGKVVWPWGLPNKITFDEQGKFLAYDPSVASRLLNVKFKDFEDSGNYYSRPTQEGRNWGMPVWLKTSFSSVELGNDLIPLAHDEYGRISAFVKRFHSRLGSGWVSYGPNGFGVPITATELQTLDRVASYTID